jgi:hypothetical protein
MNPEKVQQRQPYILIMHSIANRNFEIHIFALQTFQRKFQDVTKATIHRSSNHTGPQSPP